MNHGAPGCTAQIPEGLWTPTSRTTDLHNKPYCQNNRVRLLFNIKLMTIYAVII